MLRLVAVVGGGGWGGWDGRSGRGLERGMLEVHSPFWRERWGWWWSRVVERVLVS